MAWADPPAPQPVGGGPVATPAPHGVPPAPPSGDAPEISRSVGAPGGVVVLWPRIVPRTDDPAILGLGALVQAHAVSLAAAVRPGAPLDVRPSPERVCPRSGCVAPQLGSMLIHQRGGCAVVALVAGAGPSASAVVPWVGAMSVLASEVAFREPPEPAVRVLDMVPCDQIAASLPRGDAAVGAALGAAR